MVSTKILLSFCCDWGGKSGCHPMLQVPTNQLWDELVGWMLLFLAGCCCLFVVCCLLLVLVLLLLLLVYPSFTIKVKQPTSSWIPPTTKASQPPFSPIFVQELLRPEREIDCLVDVGSMSDHPQMMFVGGGSTFRRFGVFFEKRVGWGEEKKQGEEKVYVYLYLLDFLKLDYLLS